MAPLLQLLASGEAAKCCFSKTCGFILICSGSYQWKAFFSFYQTILCVAAGEPHPQPHSQTATKTHMLTKFGSGIKIIFRSIKKLYFSRPWTNYWYLSFSIFFFNRKIFFFNKKISYYLLWWCFKSKKIIF